VHKDLLVRRVIDVIVSGATAAARWSWEFAHRLLAARRSAPGPGDALIRRGYVFGAIGRRAYDAAMRKKRR